MMRCSLYLAMCAFWLAACGLDVDNGPNPNLGKVLEGSASIYPDSECRDDQLEPNDSWDKPISLPMGTTRGLSVCGNDDWYLYSLRAGETLTVEIQFHHRDGDLDMRLDTDSGRLINASRSTNDNESITVTAVQDEVVRIAVEGYSTDWLHADENDYTLVAGVEGSVAPEGCVDDDSEPNDEYEDATRIYLLDFGQWKNKRSCPGNKDWFFYDASPNQLGHTITVEITGEVELYISLPENREDWYQGDYSRVTGKTTFSYRVRKPDMAYFLVGGVEKPVDYSMRLKDFMPEMEPVSLGAMCGDYFDRTRTITDFGAALYSIKVEECSSMPYRMYIHAKLTLPYGVTYDLTLYDEDWNMVSSPYLMIGPGEEPDYEYAVHSYGGYAFHGDHQTYYIQVDLFGIHVDQREDADWQLDIRGGSEGF